MISKETKLFDVEGKKMRFQPSTFKSLFREYRMSSGMKAGELTEMIAEKASVSCEAVNNWRSGSNGPGDIESVKAIADVLELSDWTVLMLEANEEEKMNQLSEMQIESVKRIYDAIVSFLDEFERTDGFNNYWFELQKKERYASFSEMTESEAPDSDAIMLNGFGNISPTKIALEELVDNKYSDLLLTYKKEYLFLKDQPIYEEIGNLLYDENGLDQCYSGKLSYGYRFEAMVEDIHGNRGVTTSEDYELAMNKINSIIEKYF